MSYQLHIGDSLEVLKTLPANSIDSVVTDPPYGIDFMGKDWDQFGGRAAHKQGGKEFPDFPMRTRGDTIAVQAKGNKAFQDWCEQWAAECLRVLKPGGHLVAFGGTRTYHRLASGIEDAGFEIRDKLDWIYGSGFPKSLDVSKAIDKAAGADREVIGPKTYADGTVGYWNSDSDTFAQDAWTKAQTGKNETAPATDAAKQWEGWGTALKPAHEPIVLARKPLDARPLVTVHNDIKTNNTVAANVLEHGTGGLNIDTCRVETSAADAKAMERANTPGSGRMKAGGSPIDTFVRSSPTGAMDTTAGRWPPNILLSHSPYCTNIRQRRIEDPASWDCAEGCPVKEMDRQSGISKSTGGFKPGVTGVLGKNDYGRRESPEKDSNTLGFGDTGGASRFFPIIEWDEESTVAYEFNFKYQAKAAKKERPSVDGVAAHPTVKPVALMRWLAKLVTPPGGTVLEPFGGSGTTAEACELEGFDCVIIEREQDYGKLIDARMAKYDTPKEVA